MAERRQGPRQVWTWSRIDGSITQHLVRPSKLADCWVEDWDDSYSYGWQRWPEQYLCSSPEEAARQARAHFQRISDETQAILARIA